MQTTHLRLSRRWVIFMKLFEFKCARIELVILTLLGNQIVVRTALDDPALFENHNHVGVSYGGKSVCDDEDRSAVHQTVHTL